MQVLIGQSVSAAHSRDAVSGQPIDSTADAQHKEIHSRKGCGKIKSRDSKHALDINTSTVVPG